MRRLFFTAGQWARAAIVLTFTVFALLQLGATSLAGDSTVFSFGDNVAGLTGLGTTSGETLIATPIDTTNLAGKTITEVAAGLYHSLVLADDGTVFSFGWNYYGQTSLGTHIGNTLVATPIDTTNLAGKRITQLAAGYEHSLLLADDGTVLSCGRNNYGQTGLGTEIGNTLIATPIETTNLAGRTITQVAAGHYHSLLLADDGTVFSFGWNYWGATGLGTTSGNTLVATPIDTTNLVGKTITQVAAGGMHSLLLADDGTVFSFGGNWSGQTGLSTDTGNTLVATPIDTTNVAGKPITQVAAGSTHSLLLAGDGSVFSFGSNSNGVTGLGTHIGNTLIATPIDTTNLAGKTITHMAAGTLHSLLLADDGTVFSCGYNEAGRTGLDTAGGSALIATPIDTTNLVGLRGIGISAGSFHSLLLAVPVPEPGAATLLLLAALPLLVGRRIQWR